MPAIACMWTAVREVRRRRRRRIVLAYSDAEVPAGIVNGLNQIFTLANVPSPISSVEVYHNGILMEQGLDYTISGGVITFSPATVPQVGDIVLVNYRYAN